MTAATEVPGLDRNRLAAIRRREDAVFQQRTTKTQALARRARRHLPNAVPMSWMSGLYGFPPIYVAHGDAATFIDVDGNRYLDFNLCDLSMTMGFGSAPIVAAVTRAMRSGAHFLLPTEDAIAVAEELARRVGLPHWQFTLSASGANSEVMRIARVMTGRNKIALFEGHYHGHLDETLVANDANDANGRSIPDLLGTSRTVAENTVLLPFNDLAAIERRLAQGDIALLLTEPMLTNCNLVMPQPGFHQALREITQRHQTLLCLDEAHTFQFAYGGLVAAWQLEADFVVLGKGLGTGISFALYGMSDEVAAVFMRHADVDLGTKGIATGGTTYASALAVAAARSALEQVLTPAGHARINGLGARLADGLDTLFRNSHLPWTAHRMGPRAGYCLHAELPRNGREAWRSIDEQFINTRRVYLANRGVWDAVASAGPQASFAHADGDIDTYLHAAAEFLAEITV